MRRAYSCLLLLLVVGCNRSDTEALTRITKRIAGRAEALTGDMRTSASSSWQGAGPQESGVEGRAAARLRWDKQLADTPIEVVPAGAGVELRGKVRNLEQRRRAVMLADSTAGVEGVKDSLVESER